MPSGSGCMASEATKYVWDATEAARRALKFTRGKSFADYQADDMLRAAVERQLAILGEALSRLRQIEPTLAGRITDLNRAVGLRNVLVHAYAEIDDALIWGVLEGPLPGLLAQLEGL